MITFTKTPSTRMVNADTSLADELNTFYTCFKAAANSSNSAGIASSVSSAKGSTISANGSVSEWEMLYAYGHI